MIAWLNIQAFLPPLGRSISADRSSRRAKAFDLARE